MVGNVERCVDAVLQYSIDPANRETALVGRYQLDVGRRRMGLRSGNGAGKYNFVGHRLVYVRNCERDLFQRRIVCRSLLPSGGAQQRREDELGYVTRNPGTSNAGKPRVFSALAPILSLPSALRASLVQNDPDRRCPFPSWRSSSGRPRR